MICCRLSYVSDRLYGFKDMYCALFSEMLQVNGLADLHTAMAMKHW